MASAEPTEPCGEKQPLENEATEQDQGEKLTCQDLEPKLSKAEQRVKELELKLGEELGGENR